MARPSSISFKHVRLSLTKELSEMLNFLSAYYCEPGTQVLKKSLERLYYQVKQEENPHER